MKNTTRRGFTLIELLVVIAIIGILSSIILASLNGARSKGNDAKVEGQLVSARSAAELYNTNNLSYSTSTVSTGCALSGATVTCPATAGGLFTDSASGMASLMNLNNFPSGTSIDAAVSVAKTSYSIAALAADGVVWCIDSTGVSRGKTSGGTLYSALTGSGTAAHTAPAATVCN